jgi:hypothetical protein
MVSNLAIHRHYRCAAAATTSRTAIHTVEKPRQAGKSSLPKSGETIAVPAIVLQKLFARLCQSFAIGAAVRLQPVAAAATNTALARCTRCTPARQIGVNSANYWRG